MNGLHWDMDHANGGMIQDEGHNTNGFNVEGGEHIDFNTLITQAENNGAQPLFNIMDAPNTAGAAFQIMQEGAMPLGVFPVRLKVTPKPRATAESSRRVQKVLERSLHTLKTTTSWRKYLKALDDIDMLNRGREALSHYHDAQSRLYWGMYLSGKIGCSDFTPEDVRHKLGTLEVCIDVCNHGVSAAMDPSSGSELSQPYFDLMYTARRCMRKLRLQYGLEDTDIYMNCPPYDIVEDYGVEPEEDLSSDEEDADDDMDGNESDAETRKRERKEDNYDAIASRVTKPDHPDPTMDGVRMELGHASI